MKKLMLAAILFCGVQATSFAQDGGFKRHSPKERAEMQTEKMATSLGLNDEQKKAVLEINLKSAEKIANAGDNRREAFKEVQAQNEEEFKKVLTADQFTKYQELRKERMAKMRDHKPAE